MTPLLLPIVALGLCAGALVAEGAILVPFWRSIPAEEFLAWYRKHAKLLVDFFGPIEIAAAVLTILAAAWFQDLPLIIAAICAFLVLAVFPLYFKAANASFAAGTIEVSAVGEELRRWAAWHWGRTILAITAFVLAAIARP